MKKNWRPGLSRSKIDFWGVHLGVSVGWYAQTMSKYSSYKYLLISKQTGTLDSAVQKIDFLEGPFGEVSEGGDTPKLCQDVCLLKSTDIKKTGALA